MSERSERAGGGYEHVCTREDIYGTLAAMTAEAKERNMSGQVDRTLWSDKAVGVITEIQQAMDDWRQANDPAADHGPTMAEFVALRLARRGMLA